MAEKKRVLVLDDQSSIAVTLVWILERQGYQAEAEIDGRAALERARRLRPHALICDVNLGAVNGIEVARAIAADARCKVLLLTGDASSEKLLREARGEGIDYEVLPKPIAPPEILARLEKLIGKPGP